MKCSLFIMKFFSIFQLRHVQVKKGDGFSLPFHTASNGELGGAWEQGYSGSEQVKFRYIAN